MIRFIAAMVFGLILSFGYTTFYHYQLVFKSNFDIPTMVVVALTTVIFTFSNFFLSFWNLAGFPRKPQSWKYFEAQGIPYSLKRDNLNILALLGLSFGLFSLLSLGVDMVLGNNFGTTVKSIFYNDGQAKAVELSYYWNPLFWFLFSSYYGTALVSIALILWQMLLRRDEEEVKESEREIYEGTD